MILMVCNAVRPEPFGFAQDRPVEGLSTNGVHNRLLQVVSVLAIGYAFNYMRCAILDWKEIERLVVL